MRITELNNSGKEDKEKLENLITKVHEVFRRYNYREDIEAGLRDLGFKLWTYIDDNEDEQIWAYDVGTPNGQLLILINWIDAFYWIYKKVGRGDV